MGKANRAHAGRTAPPWVLSAQADQSLQKCRPVQAVPGSWALPVDSLRHLRRGKPGKPGEPGIAQSGAQVAQNEAQPVLAAKGGESHESSATSDGCAVSASQRDTQLLDKKGLSGWRGIRTPGALTDTAVFKTAALDHSAIHPTRFMTMPYVESETSISRCVAPMLTPDPISDALLEVLATREFATGGVLGPSLPDLRRPGNQRGPSRLSVSIVMPLAGGPRRSGRSSTTSGE